MTAYKYEKTCWSCRGHNLAPDEHGVVCRDCGATWNSLPRVGSLPLRDVGPVVYGERDRGPSASVQKSATRARARTVKSRPETGARP